MKQSRLSLQQLHRADDFASRHIGPAEQDQQSMLAALGLSSLDQLIEKVVPESIRRRDEMQIGAALTEHEAMARLKTMADNNQLLKSYLGLGYHNTLTPPTIQRNILENPAWYTAYTPYQAEISQGRMEAMFNFQTMVTDLTGLELANASLLDEATACAEAMTLCQRMSKSKGKLFFVADDCHPQNIDVVKTRASTLDIEVVVGDPMQDLQGLDLFGVLLQYPGTSGEIRDYRAICEQAHAQKALVAVSADLLSLTLLTPPGEFGADVAVGNTQRFGVPLFYGGPHAAYMATRDAFKRSMPGRLIGLSIDSHGNPAYRLALQTREQHIRREKATSNICTAQALLAVIASMYAVYHGPRGLQQIAERIQRLTAILAKGLRQSGLEITNRYHFDTITLNSGDKTDAYLQAAVDRGYNLRRLDAAHISIALDESTTAADVEQLWAVFCGADHGLSAADLDAEVEPDWPSELVRSSAYLTHEVFHSYHSETEMMRYMRSLADKDLALDRAMIPLGSCTMKLNAAAELMPVSWPGFAGLHPYAPLDQAQGYAQLIEELEQLLCAATGYDAVSLQPNSGAQGEYAGLLAIRAYHDSRGDQDRDICLIPSSAHGTNPASAHMAGMRVIVVATDEQGNISLDDLKAKLEQHGDKLAAIMITYPSTHGVFEASVVEVCDLIHQHGGQVYIDGANMNAMVGVCSPGKFGGDVSHLNLHKTFAIPHGGGGPGVGPIGVVEHLKPFLPGYSQLAGGPEHVGPVSGAPWGSAGILPISWAYISMMGQSGVTQATQVAILNANYMAQRLQDHFPILYTDANGMIAHECIIDLRPIKDEIGITVDDVAKRLIDYGFHAPTMSFPVPGTLMIEPTESESRQEIDRFCDAMIAIKQEIDAVAAGELDKEDNPLKHAPHTVDSVTGDDWAHGYSRQLAAFPVASLKQAKYWSPVGRVDNVYGDRNLVCSCPPVAEYAEPDQVAVA
ncbi:MAG: aminomethyl-transferring glycine dehydrogenase [Gammaproteobacteria bacterium]|nr:aminomethyl-transferring glycine dehydrogenase [Gammaproteobacteria bacterium]